MRHPPQQSKFNLFSHSPREKRNEFCCCWWRGVINFINSINNCFIHHKFIQFFSLEWEELMNLICRGLGAQENEWKQRNGMSLFGFISRGGRWESWVCFLLRLFFVGYRLRGSQATSPKRRRKKKESKLSSSLISLLLSISRRNEVKLRKKRERATQLFLFLSSFLRGEGSGRKERKNKRRAALSGIHLPSIKNKN